MCVCVWGGGGKATWPLPSSEDGSCSPADAVASWSAFAIICVNTVSMLTVSKQKTEGLSAYGSLW